MKIIFNGKKINTDSKNTKEFFKSINADKNNVWIINGFATQDNIELKENDEIFYIKKGEMPPKNALKSMMRARHTPKLYDKLKNAHVAIAGLGGLGSHISIMLARCGVGKLTLIDFDVIEPSNLNRQAYNIKDLGKLKTKAMKKNIKKINSFIKVKIHTKRVTKDNISKLFKDCDIVCEAFDSADAKTMLANNFHTFFPEKILICASGLAGYANSNDIKTKEIAPNFYICGDLKSGARPGNGLMAPRVNICAAHQANLVIELLAKDSKSLE